jgi:hypothetical protein
MFFDEAIHILWGNQWESHGLSRAMADGKLLEVIVGGVALRVLPAHPLWAVRMGTVLVGLVTLWAAFWLGRRLGGPPGGLISASIVVACPFFLFHDRMGLADPFVSAFASVALVATIRLCDGASLGRGVVLGLALAAAGASKVLGLMAFAASLAGVLLLAPRQARAWRGLALAWGIGAVLLWVPTRAFLRSGGQVGEKAALGVDDRWGLVLQNLASLSEWLWVYWTPPLLAAGLLVTLWALARWRGEGWLLVFAWAFPLTVFVVGARLWYPRYILFATVPLVALVGGGVGELWSHARGGATRGAALVLCAVLLVPSLVFDWRLLADPSSARLPGVDRWQYVEGWPSGYGWAGAHDFLVDALGSQAGPHRIATERYHWTLEASFVDRPDVRVKAFDVGHPAELARAAEAGYRWLVVSRPVGPERPPGLELTHVAGFTKPGREGTVNVYRMGWSGPGGD